MLFRSKKPAFFRNPVHCVKIANDGKIYVCDRGNDRIQVFDKNSPDIFKAKHFVDKVDELWNLVREEAIKAQGGHAS